MDIEKANNEVIERMMEARPTLVGLGKAIDVIPGMKDNLLLHAGPPITWGRMCGPTRGAVMGALVYEGLVETPEQAAFLRACALMFVAYTGYGRIATLGEEVREPRRTIPRAIVITLAVSAVLAVAGLLLSQELSWADFPPENLLAVLGQVLAALDEAATRAEVSGFLTGLFQVANPLEGRGAWHFDPTDVLASATTVCRLLKESMADPAAAVSHWLSMAWGSAWRFRIS